MRNYEYYSLVSMEDVENDFTVPRIMFYCIDVPTGTKYGRMRLLQLVPT